MRLQSLIRLACTLFVAFAFSACSTIYFDHGSGTDQMTYSEWHHDGILQLVEFSSPVDMHDRCQGRQFESVRVERSFITGFIGELTEGWYDPWDVSYACK